MAHTMTLEVPDDVYHPLAEEAKLRGQTPEQLVLDKLRKLGPEMTSQNLTKEQQAEAFANLIKYAGAVSVPDPTNADNEAIDRDLATAYGETHDEEQ